MSLAQIAPIFKKHNHNIKVYPQDIHHYPEEHLTKYLDDNEFDFVCCSVIGGYYQYRKLLSISKAINQSKNRHKFKYLIGGYGPTPESAYYLKKTGADIVVRGEGEKIFCLAQTWKISKE